MCEDGLKIWEAIGTDEFSDLLETYLSSEYWDGSFVDMQDRYTEEVLFEVNGDLTEGDGFYTIPLVASFTEHTKTDCCDITRPNDVVVKVVATIYEGGDIDVKPTDEDWHATDGDYY